MNSINNGLIPVVATTFIIVLFIVIIGLVDKLLRHEAIATYRESLRNFRIVRVFKINFLNTSLFSLALSLIRFNILSYLLIKTIGNMLFGSDTNLFNINYVICYVIVCEFLFFLKTKKKNEINELSTISLSIVFTLGLIGLYKLSSNLIVEKKIFWLDSDYALSSWSILEFPALVLPMFYILVSLYTRIIKSSVALKYNSVDRLFDYLSNNLLYIYMVCLFLRTIVGGVTDITLIGSAEYTQIDTLISIIIKFTLLSVITRLLIRFLPSVVDFKRRDLTPLMLLITFNIVLIHFLKGGL
ncbi:hypothetical protein [Halobacteriovorax sp.]|uniref:hypothetical protein n=1 Tax=Halobacteriovorax sp. TaxID=2020862 RepID=UPI0035613F14